MNLISNEYAKKRYGWLKSNRPSQLTWVKNQLIKRGVYTTTYMHGCSDYDLLIQALDRLVAFQANDHAKENGVVRVNRVKNAWYQHQYRKKCKTSNSTRKPFNNALSKTHIEKLRAIAETENKTMNLVLEELIDRGYIYNLIGEKIRESALKKEIIKLQENIKSLKSHSQALKNQLVTKKKLVETECKLKEEKDFNDDLLWELCQNMALLESANLAQQKLNLSQQLRAQELHKSVLNLTQRKMNNIINKISTK